MGNIHLVIDASNASWHPIAILSNDSNILTYSGDASKKFTKLVNGNIYEFYYGDITVNVLQSFDKISIYCYNHGYMGGENILQYNETCSLESQPEPEPEPEPEQEQLLDNILEEETYQIDNLINENVIKNYGYIKTLQVDINYLQN